MRINKVTRQLLALATLLISCSTDNNIAGGSETGNPVIAGYIYNDDATPSGSTIVTLSTGDYYNNSKNIDDTIYLDTTDEYGFFIFDSVAFGNYNLKSVKDIDKKVSFTSNIEISEFDTLHFYDTLSDYSYIELILPKDIDTANQILFIQGTDYFFDLHDATEIENGEWLIVLEGIPDDIYLDLYILDISDTIDPILIDSFMIDEAGDTLEIGVFDISKIIDNSNSKLSSNTITTLLMDQNNNALWIGTYLGGLLKWDLSVDTMTHYNISNSEITDNYITSLAMDSKDRLYIGTHQGGLNILDNGIWSSYTNSDVPGMGNNITALATTSDNKCLIGTIQAFVRLDLDSGFTDTYESLIPDDGITSIAVIDDYNYWLGTSFSGLINLFNDTANYYSSYDSDIPDDFITALKKDSKGNVWIGTIYGVSKIDTNQTIKTEITDYSGKLDIFSITEDLNGFIWFGLQGDPSLLRYNGISYKEYYMDYIDLEENPGNINSIIELNNNYYVATENAGLIILNENLRRVKNRFYTKN